MKYLKEAIQPYYIFAFFLCVLTGLLLDVEWYYVLVWIAGYWLNLEIYRKGRNIFLLKD